MTEIINFPNIGFLKINLTQEQVLPILTEVEKIKENFDNATKVNRRLAGNIKKEYELTESTDHINSLISMYAQEFEDNFNYFSRVNILSKSIPVIVNNAWVNFQEKYEFNPVHDHAGIISFVIWLKIPFISKNETELSPGVDAMQSLSGKFCFYYTDVLGNICQYSIPADETMENSLLIFPSKLKHAVYPFYSSDDYRISVSGNVVFQI